MAGLPLQAAHLDLDVNLDPRSRLLVSRAVLELDGAQNGFTLSSGLVVRKALLDGRPLQLSPGRREGGLALYVWPSTARKGRLELHYSGRLAPLDALDHRQVLGPLPAMAGPQGSYLPAGSGWYPDPGTPFSYRVRLTLPPGQKGLVPGNPLDESPGRRRYVARYDFPHAARGIDLMAGPYVTAEHNLTLPDGKPVQVRTWLHAELGDLAQAYLMDSARYLERYSRQIGDYPFNRFSVVSSPLPTGFGMPSLAYLGRQVLRLPFIRASSLGHEVLHNWWGNGVYPDWEQGNWSEGLTTFMADYAYKEDESPATAREQRLAWLRDLAAVPAAQDIPLKDFVSRHHGISSIVGYSKAAMVFFMLRDRIGPESFARGLRLLWQRKRFQTASWADLEAVFSEVSGQDLGAFFSQWVSRAGAPRLSLGQVVQQGGSLTIEVLQEGDFRLRLPLRLLVYPDATETRVLELEGPASTARFDVQGLVQAVEPDPDYRLWRRLDPALFPAILREVFAAPRASLILGEADAAFQTAARNLAGGVLDTLPTEIQPDTPVPQGALLIIAPRHRIQALLTRLSLPVAPSPREGQGTARVWAGRDGQGRPYAVVAARDADGLQALARGLPHFGRQSWLVFEDGRLLDKGVWPARPERTRVLQQGPSGRP
ncbi:MAG TPA: M1 family aminopeptidase [Thiobacillaceae bacterium]|nr:M1 family aminopeptidase [Thiobacillaceae bacterium]HNU64312.1 M1 family aminopeptidase [Thiobacillaceae bacterium]